MNKLKEEYEIFMNTKFNNLVLRRPLFYNWEYGLRFNLQDFNKIDTEEYFIEGIKRSTELFFEVFNNCNELYMIIQEYREKQKDISRSNYIFKQMKNITESIDFTREKLYDEDDIYNVVIMKTDINPINYKNILTGIENNDFCRKPIINEEIYFINIEKEIIFNMYDHRGLDIIASNKEILKPIYEKYNHLLLDYDREKMYNLFI